MPAGPRARVLAWRGWHRANTPGKAAVNAPWHWQWPPSRHRQQRRRRRPLAASRRRHRQPRATCCAGPLPPPHPPAAAAAPPPPRQGKGGALEMRPWPSAAWSPGACLYMGRAPLSPGHRRHHASMVPSSVIFSSVPGFFRASLRRTLDCLPSVIPTPKLLQNITSTALSLLRSDTKLLVVTCEHVMSSYKI